MYHTNGPRHILKEFLPKHRCCQRRILHPSLGEVRAHKTKHFGKHISIRLSASTIANLASHSFCLRFIAYNVTLHATLVVSSKGVPYSHLPPHPFPRSLFPFLAIVPVSYQHPFKRGLKTRNGTLRNESERLSLSQLWTGKWLFRKMLFQRGVKLPGSHPHQTPSSRSKRGKKKKKTKNEPLNLLEYPDPSKSGVEPLFQASGTFLDMWIQCVTSQSNVPISPTSQ